MKTFLTYLMLFSSCISVMAINIKGKVIDSENNPVEFANISALADDSIIGGCYTDSIGCFYLSVSDKCNKVRVSYIGYSDTILSPVGNNLGNITLYHTSTMLNKVVVKSSPIRREADRIILNIAANPLSANKDAHDMLKTAPGVWATDNSLSIYGQNGTTVYIDDRKVNLSGSQLMTYLKSIQSSTIATIEIIPKAGAEFSASAAGGIIRINLKRNLIEGLSGSAGINTTYGKYKTWLNPFANLNLHSGKMTVNLSSNLNGSPSDRRTTHEMSDNDNSALTLNGTSKHRAETLQGNITLGLFYTPTEKDRIGIQMEYNPDRNNTNVSSRTGMYAESVDETTLGNYHSKYRFHNLNIALNLSHSLDNKGSVLKWNSNYNYQTSSTDENNHMRWLSVDKDSIYLTGNHNTYNIFDTEIALQKNFTSGWRFNTGIKYTHNDVGYDSRHFDMHNDERSDNTTYDYDSNYHENIAGAYATLNAQTGRWRFKAGVRGEYYHTAGLEINQSDIALFPNANIAYNLNERGDYTVAIGYYRNIRRPSFQSLNPTVRQISDYSYTVGNTDLRPSFVNSVSLDFILARKYTLATGYSQTANPIRQMFKSTGEHSERMYLTWENIGKDRSCFIHGDGFTNITGWWNLYASLTYAVTSQQFDNKSGHDTFGYIQAVAVSTFILPYSFNITLNGFYQTRMKVGNITVYPILNLNPTVNKRFGKSWTVSLGIENMVQRKGKIRAASSGYDRLTYTKQFMTAKLGITYNFNSGTKFSNPKIEKATDQTRFNKE